MVGYTSTPVFRGTHGWTFVQAPDMVVPPSTAKLVVRAALTGKGEAYFDDLALQIIGDSPHGDGELKAQVKGRIVETLPVTRDCMILAYIPQWNHGNVDNIAVANNDGGVRTLLAWQEPTPQQLSRPNLRFLLAMYVRDSHTPDKPRSLQMHDILDDWNERTSWEKRPLFASEPAARFEITATNGWNFFDVTALLQKHAKGPKPTFGVVLRFADESSDADKSTYSSYQFVSREGIGPWESRRPVLLVVDPTQPPANTPAVKPTSKVMEPAIRH